MIENQTRTIQTENTCLQHLFGLPNFDCIKCYQPWEMTVEPWAKNEDVPLQLAPNCSPLGTSSVNFISLLRLFNTSDADRKKKKISSLLFIIFGICRCACDKTMISDRTSSALIVRHGIARPKNLFICRVSVHSTHDAQILFIIRSALVFQPRTARHLF